MTVSELFDAEERTSSRSGAPKRRRRWIVHVIVWPLLALVLIGGGIAAWSLYDDAISVRADLEDASSAVGEFQTAAAERRLADLPAIAERLETSAQSAVEPTAQPLWSMGELIPVVGENFRAVRIIAEGVDDISAEVVTPASTLAGSFALARDPATGGFDLAPLREATEISTTAQALITDLHDEVQSIDTSATIGQVGDAVDRFDDMLGTAEAAIPQLNGALAGVGALLGIDGPRTVVLAFLNNAEAAALGGGPAAQTLLRVDNGTINIAEQVSSVDFPIGIPVDVAVDDSAKQLYDSIFLDNLNAATSRPDFPTAAAIISANWQRTKGITPDVVASIDPIALSRLLQVTGPVTMPDGEQLTSENVVSKLLNEAYFRFPEGGAESDAYFAEAASAVFARIMSAEYDIWAMADAVIDAANRGSLMMWSADPATQELFDGTRLQGVLPQGNEGATVVGVYYRDRSSSKIDYYLRTDATITTNTCNPDAPTWTVETRLRFDIPADVELPLYVDSSFYDHYITEVFLYGPIGASTASVEVPEPGRETTTGPSVVDLNRPVEKFTVHLDNGQTALVRATFQGTPGDYGPTETRVTPMINATNVTMSDATCG
ncbi:DUF4012 domain-containing protein [Agromyces mariniharenae]|uniref:DUF4012 domain-containing protein n=1 Tax=Agromyces mariniharenae TaxID=2604423 RepID=A0A5S4V350_9MICO|nr:DUF4012 domain-containing protein [Agromyces mariniharenae]TYL52638.1 DUF4012 domain-containing protein [Agromyces mariniharenae]